MHRRSGIIATALLGPLLCAVQAQRNPGAVTTPSEDRSPYLGRLVMHPEALSGIWETSNGSGGAVGIHLELGTMVSGDGDKPSWIPQAWQDLQVGVFERRGAEIDFGEEGFFSDSLSGGSVTFDTGRLQLHFASRWTDVASVDLDLVQQADDCWHGRLHRGSFDSDVTLCRPIARKSGKANPLVGTWSESLGFGDACVHIAERASGELTGWSDAIQPPGTVQFATTISGPHALYQHFGELMKVHLQEGGTVSFRAARLHLHVLLPHVYRKAYRRRHVDPRHLAAGRKSDSPRAGLLEENARRFLCHIRFRTNLGKLSVGEIVVVKASKSHSGQQHAHGAPQTIPSKSVTVYTFR